MGLAHAPFLTRIRR